MTGASTQISSRRPRVIPILQMSGQDLVKTTGFKNPQYLGDPLNAVRIFNDSEADELVLIDIQATKEGRAPDLDFLGALASMAQMPLAYGGGISSANQAGQIVKLGFEKIAVQSLIWDNPRAIKEIAGILGSQAVLISVDILRHGSDLAVKKPLGKQTAGIDTITDVIDLALSHGAGELLVTSVEREGTFLGPDLELAQKARRLSDIPLIYNGGVTKEEDFVKLARSGVDGIGVGARFLFRDESRSLMINYPTQQNLRELFGTQI